MMSPLARCHPYCLTLYYPIIYYANYLYRVCFWLFLRAHTRSESYVLISYQSWKELTTPSPAGVCFFFYCLPSCVSVLLLARVSGAFSVRLGLNKMETTAGQKEHTQK